MKYTRVYIESMGYELAPVVVTSVELETRLASVYETLHLTPGQLEAMTGIYERRWWRPGFRVADGAIAAARKALGACSAAPNDVGALIYAAVCRESFEPATACRVAHALGISPSAAVLDISNACLGVINGIMDVANRIELGQVRAGLVVASETAREINELTIAKLAVEPRIETFTKSLATLTGGSAAIAVLVTDGSFSKTGRRKVLGGVTETAVEHYDLCKWGIRPVEDNRFEQYATTDAAAVLKHGVALGVRTWDAFLEELGWTAGQVDKVICHQVGKNHEESILKALGIAAEKDFVTYPFLGNTGTVALPITAALAEEREFLQPGGRVGFLGIGSGLNCLMLGLEW